MQHTAPRDKRYGREVSFAEKGSIGVDCVAKELVHCDSRLRLARTASSWQLTSLRELLILPTLMDFVVWIPCASISRWEQNKILHNTEQISSRANGTGYELSCLGRL